MLRKRFVALLIVLSSICLVSCDSGENSDSGAPDAEVKKIQSDSAPSKPEFGGTYRTASIGEPSNLIPQLSTDSASHELANYLFVSLLKYDKNLKVVTEGAESFEVLNDGKLLRFKIHPGIRWTDGVEMTSKDVEFTYKLMVDPETPTAYAESFKLVKEFRVTGKYTFEVEYERPYARALTTWMTTILPKHLFEGEDLLTTKYIREPVSNGAYILKEWVPGTRIVLEANPDYFEGRPYFDKMVYRIIPDQATMFLELKAGNLDIMNVTPQQYKFQVTGPQWDKNFNKYEYLGFSYSYLGYNQEHWIFKDKAVRRALAHAINKDAIIKGVYFGLGTPVIGPYKPDSLWYNKDIEPYAYSPEQAKRMLAEAGWKDSDGDGLLDKNGKPFEFTIMTNQGNKQRERIAIIIQENLSALGIKVNIRTVEWAAFLKEFIDKNNFDAIVMGWSTIIDPDLYNVWHSSNAVPGGLNFIRYINPELDELLEEGRHMVNRDERKKLYDRVQMILHEDQPYCFLVAAKSLPVVSARIRGISPAPAGIGYNFTEWWIPKKYQKTLQQ